MSASKVQKSPAHSNGAMPKVVGPNVQGNREEYQLVRRLQSALFGGVYEAKGLSSNRDFAIKVLHKSELTKAQESTSIEFCEVPLSEIRFAELMRGNPYVMEPEEHFEDSYCFYVVFDLCRGGDLLEALKQKPHGFDEAHAQYLIKQAALGLAFLHERHVAMQDVSLENMLLHVQENTGHYQVKICDPGQAVIFDVDSEGQELAVNFRGLVGKSFRPPELHEQQPYSSTKVDSWCLGWSTFYLLTAQPLFMSADPAQQDSDWLLFQQGDFATLFQQKCNLCSPTGLDFIFRLLQIEPRRRMSIADALNHQWLSDQSICPVIAPKDVLAEMSMYGVMDNNRPLEVVDGYDGDQLQGVATMSQQNSLIVEAGLQPAGGPTYSPPAGKPLSGMAFGQSNELPTWAAAQRTSGTSSQIFGGAPYGGYANDGNSMLRAPMSQRARGEVRSPLRSPRSARASGGPQLTFDAGRQSYDRLAPSQDGRERARYANPARMAHVISTAHSPAPQGRGGSPPPRAGSPLQRQWSPNELSNPNSNLGSGSYPTSNMGNMNSISQMQQGGTSMGLTPRSASGRHSPGQSPLSSAVPAANLNNQANVEDERSRGRAWAFRSNSPIRDGVSPGPDYGRQRAASPFGNATAVMRPGSATYQVPGGPGRHSPGPHSRFAQGSGGLQSGGITFPRSLSPGLLENSSLQQPGSSAVRAHSPGAGIRTLSPNGNLAGSTRLNEGSGGFNWTSAPPLSPRAGNVSRIASPSGMQAGVSRIASPTGGLKQAPQPIMQGAGFAWSPEPASPRTSPRSYSPSPQNMSSGIKAGGNALPRWPPM